MLESKGRLVSCQRIGLSEQTSDLILQVFDLDIGMPVGRNADGVHADSFGTVAGGRSGTGGTPARLAISGIKCAARWMKCRISSGGGWLPSQALNITFTMPPSYCEIVTSRRSRGPRSRRGRKSPVTMLPPRWLLGPRRRGSGGPTQPDSPTRPGSYVS